MTDRVRQPLFWLVAAEVAVMFALLWVSWRVYEAHRVATPGAAAALRAPDLPRTSTPTPAVAFQAPPSAPSASAASSRLARTVTGVPVDLSQLNRDQATLEQMEDSLLTRAAEAARAYLEAVVLPAVRRAESESRTTSAAAAQSPAATRKMP